MSGGIGNQGGAGAGSAPPAAPPCPAVLRDIESILERESGTLTGAELLCDIGWDSMAVVMFIAIMDSKRGAAIPPRQIALAKSVADLCALVDSHSAHAAS